MLDFLLRAGPYGDGFGDEARGPDARRCSSDGPTASTSARSSRGCPTCCARPSGRIELAPEPIVADLERLRGRRSAAQRNGGMVLIGRRQLRSNNSWMHNLPALVKGKDRCTLQVHPDDAARLGLEDGGRARVRSAAGPLEAPVEVTDAIMPGVVSIPHGWGHDGARRAPRRGRRARRREQQPARRRDAGGPAVGQRGAERHPGGGRPA